MLNKLKDILNTYTDEELNELETELNLLIEKLDKHNQEIVDIKYSISHFLDEDRGQIYIVLVL